MLENNTNARLAAGILIAVLTLFTATRLVRAQSFTSQEAVTPTPEATPTPFPKAPSPAEVFQIAPAWEVLPPGAVPPPIAHPPAEGQNACFKCHLELGDEHTEISKAWQESVHGNAEIGCAGCHGGDPRTDEMSLAMQAEAGYIGVPRRAIIPQICGGCHANVERMRAYNLPTDQYTKYFQSVHGTKLQESDTRVAICTDCHGTHNVKKGSDSTAPIYPLNIPALCAGCHSNLELMEPYGIRTDQYDLYETSIHGELLLVNQDVRAPNCASCHGSHGAKPPDDEEVINVCGKCHTATEDLFQESLHSRLGHNAPKCWTCHGTHDVFKTDESMFIRHEPQEDQHCGTCHLDNKLFRMDKVRFELKEDRRCDTCHHEGSRIMRQIIGLHNALTKANQAYQEAEEAIRRAGGLGMIVTEAESKLAEARTNLVSARAAVHTTKLPVVTKLTDEAIASASAAQAIAADKLSENLFRRLSMVVAVAIILFIIATLFFLKRDLDRQLRMANAAQVLSEEEKPSPKTAELDTGSL